MSTFPLRSSPPGVAMSFVACGYIGVSSHLCSRLVARWRGCLRNGSFLAVSCCLRRPFQRTRWWYTSSVVYTPTSLDEGRGEVIGQASTLLSQFCWHLHSCLRSVTYASWRSFLGCFTFVVAVNEGDSPIILVSCSPPFLLRHLCTPTSLDDDEGRGEVRGEVGCPHSRGLSWPSFWCSGVIFAVFGVRSRLYLCLLAVDVAETGGGD